MMDYQDSKNKSFVVETVVARDPTRASDHNKIEETCQLLKNTKAVILPGEPNPAGGPGGAGANEQAIDPSPETGAVFYSWKSLQDGDSAKLVDASNYEGVLASTFPNAGAKWRMVSIRVWSHTFFGSFDDNQAFPGGAADHLINSNVVSVYFFGGNGGVNHTGVVGAFTFTVDSETGDVNVAYTGDNAYALFRVEVSCPFPSMA